jgi:hypothetical protein
MKSFDIITEADARTLEIGSSVTLKPGGHVTPLAADTLKARRITVLSAVADASLDGLAPWPRSGQSRSAAIIRGLP